jgi:hypothetical protein
VLERDEATVAVAQEASAPDAAEAARSGVIAEAPLDADYSNVVDTGEAWQPA